MSDKKATKKEQPATKVSKSDKPASPETSGKKFAGQRFYSTSTPTARANSAAEQAKYNKPNACSLNAYFATHGISDPVLRAMMEAFTPVRRATMDDWNKIFETF